MKLRVRPMLESDLEAVLAIAAALDHAPQWPRAAYEDAIRLDGIPRRVALVAETATGASGEIAGFVVAGLVGRTAELESIAVAPAAQRCGVATALLAELVRELTAVGGEEILLEVRASNLAAQALYRRAGFGEVGRRRNYYRDPPEDAVLLRLG